MNTVERPEHKFEPVRGQTGCARCGYARGHHPNTAQLRIGPRAFLELPARLWTDQQLKERLDDISQLLIQAEDQGALMHAHNLRMARRRLEKEEGKRRERLVAWTPVSRI